MKKYIFKIRKVYTKDIEIEAKNKEKAFENILYFLELNREKTNEKFDVCLDKTIEKNAGENDKIISYSNEEIEKIVNQIYEK